MTKAANQIDPITAGLGLLGLALLGLAVIQSDRPSSSLDLRGEQQSQAQELAHRTIDQEAVKRNSELAIERIKLGCLPVVNSANTNQATTITEGQPVLDLSRGVPLGDSVIVCGLDGTTAIIQNGVAAQLAWTGDTEAIALIRSRLDAQYQTPGQ